MNEEAIKILHRLGISIYASFIVNPDFEEKDFDDLSKYAKHFGLETPFFCVLTPFPGSELFEESKGLETIKTKLGKINCFKFSPVVEVGRVFDTEDDLSIWISNDNNFIPVRVQFDLFIGSLKCDLIEYSGLKNNFAKI